MALERIGVVLLNLGSPRGPDEVRPFLRRLFDDPLIFPLRGPRWLRRIVTGRIIARRLATVKAQYTALGGGSPLLISARRQAEALGASLNARDPRREWVVTVAMRYTEPFASEALDALGSVARLVALPLYPQYSSVSTLSSLRDLETTVQARAFPARLRLVEDYAEHPGFIEAWGARIHDALARFPAACRDAAHLVFSAHGVPMRVVEAGDPYARRVRATVAALRARYSWPNPHSVSWQSRVGPMRWLGPHTEGEIERLAGAGVRDLLIVPISFTGEHLETLYEIDRGLHARAQALGVRQFERAAALETHPRFIEALGDLVLDAARS